MPAMVHKGEMIVPANENPYVNSGGKILPAQNSETVKLLSEIKNLLAVSSRNSQVIVMDKKVVGSIIDEALGACI